MPAHNETDAEAGLRIDAVPVKVVGYQTVDQTKGPDYGAYGTVTFPAANPQPYRLAGYDDHRTGIRIFVFTTGAGVLATPSYSQAGSLAAPITALTVIGSVTPTTAGYYEVTATLTLNGAPTAADINNWSLNIPGQSTLILPNGDVAGVPYQSGPFLVYFTGITGMSAKTVGVGGGAAGYQVVLSATPAIAPASTAVPAGVWVGSEAQTRANPPLGMFVPSGNTLLISHNQKVYVTGDGINAVSLSWQAERFDSPAAEISGD
jgi:hypothetical protein